MSSRRTSTSINDIHLPPDIIQDYSLDGLKELSSQDESSFYEFFQGLDLEDVKKAQQRRERIQEQNRELAVKTCEQKPKFEEIKSELRERSTEVDELRETYASKYEELKAFQSRRDNNAIKTKLIQTMKEAENKSENMASDFVSGKSDLSIDDFKDQFLELRQAYWMRKIKNEKLDELLKNQRPTPAPRGPRTPITAAQPHPLPPQHLAQSLPPHLQSQTPYPVESRRPSEPSPMSSIPPPYAAQSNVSMPRPPPPGHPFSSMPPGYQPAGYPMTRPPPPRPSAYAPYAHRY